MILGIETSCDETGLALVELSHSHNPRLIGEVLASQVDLHQKYGGVVPELASREHLRSLPLLCEELFSSSGIKLEDISSIAVTQGPGLKGCLLTGLSFAKGLAAQSRKKICGVNHIEAHILTGEMHNPDLKPPYLALVVSGGHTEILLINKVGDYKLIFRTGDDAAGEAFDKSANLLGIPYPGGPDLAALADCVKSSTYSLPKVGREIEEFSFSGLKTAISLLIQRNKSALENETERAQIAWSIQDAIVDALIHKIKKAVKKCGCANVLIVGGVSANKYLRQKISEELEIRSFFVPLKHCVDNGAMIAYAAARRIEAGWIPAEILEVHARWPVEKMSLGGEVLE